LFAEVLATSLRNTRGIFGYVLRRKTKSTVQTAMDRTGSRSKGGLGRLQEKKGVGVARGREKAVGTDQATRTWGEGRSKKETPQGKQKDLADNPCITRCSIRGRSTTTYCPGKAPRKKQQGRHCSDSNLLGGGSRFFKMTGGHKGLNHPRTRFGPRRAQKVKGWRPLKGGGKEKRKDNLFLFGKGCHATVPIVDGGGPHTISILTRSEEVV